MLMPKRVKRRRVHRGRMKALQPKVIQLLTDHTDWLHRNVDGSLLIRSKQLVLL